MEVNRGLSEWVWNNIHIDDMQKATLVPRIRGIEETLAQLEAENERLRSHVLEWRKRAAFIDGHLISLGVEDIDKALGGE